MVAHIPVRAAFRLDSVWNSKSPRLCDTTNVIFTLIRNAMKTNIKYIASFVLASMVLAGCNDLDTMPADNYVTDQQKKDALEANPALASAGVVGISSTYSQYREVLGNDSDFGWPSVMLYLDQAGTDMIGPDIGYNWFNPSNTYNFGNDNNSVNTLAWYYGYKIVKAANAVLKNIDPETTDPSLQLYASQGRANRAYIYFSLAQLFQYTYKGHENLPCVPLITDQNADAVAVDGAPRATVQEVYDQVLTDLNYAIKYLEASGLGVEKIAETGSKRFVSLGTAYGLRARVNLVMNNWQAAADDAAKAISLSGATPYSIADASKPAFNSVDAKNLMWCVYLQESDRVVTSAIVNWASHMGSLNYGYASVGATRKISKSLYDMIQPSDVRRGWFLDENATSPNLSASQQEYVTSHGYEPLVQVKFGPYNDAVGTNTNATSPILMRVEEMYLIQAEATAMAGNATAGKEMLETFVKTYRDPEYKCTATDAAGVQEAVYTQRRIELFGEGLSYYDLLRLNKPLDRRGAGFPSAYVYNVPAPLKPLLIPQMEVQVNHKLGANNEAWSQPTPVDDK